MLRIAEQFHDSDLGRQRQGNEDNYFVRAPLFVVADGMGGAQAGDSRAYLLRGGDLIRLTRDHSLVGELVARGKLTEEQAESHPQRSVITRALGPEPDVEVDVQVYQAGGRDNITVVLFRVEEIEAGSAAAAAAATDGETIEYETWEGDAIGGPRQGTGRPEAHATDEVEAEYRRSGTVALSALPRP